MNTITIEITDKWVVRFNRDGKETCLIDTLPGPNGRDVILGCISDELIIPIIEPDKLRGNG